MWCRHRPRGPRRVGLAVVVPGAADRRGAEDGDGKGAATEVGEELPPADPVQRERWPVRIRDQTRPGVSMVVVGHHVPPG